MSRNVSIGNGGVGHVTPIRTSVPGRVSGPGRVIGSRHVSFDSTGRPDGTGGPNSAGGSCELQDLMHKVTVRKHDTLPTNAIKDLFIHIMHYYQAVGCESSEVVKVFMEDMAFNPSEDLCRTLLTALVPKIGDSIRELGSEYPRLVEARIRHDALTEEEKVETQRAKCRSALQGLNGA